MAALKKYWYVVLILIWLIGTVVLYQKWQNSKDEIQLQNVELSTMKNSVLFITAKNGQLISKIESVNIERDNLRKSLEIAGFEIKGLRDENIKWRKVTNALKLELEVAGHVETDLKPDTFRIENTDTIYYSPVGDWSNSYLSIFNAKVETKKLFFDYRYNVGMKMVVEKYKDKSIVTATLTDPKATITTANSITVVPKKTIWQKWWLWTALGFTGGALLAK